MIKWNWGLISVIYGSLIFLAFAVYFALYCSGCTQVIVEKSDGTRIQANVLGSTKLDKMYYQRDDIILIIDEAEQTPDGVGEVAGEIIGTAAKAAIK